MGKPLGLGSVTCKVNAVEERKIMLKQSKVSYDVASYDYSNITYVNVGFSASVQKEFEKIAGLNSVPKQYEICYPKTIGDDDHGFEWFQDNHARQMPKKHFDMKIQYALPNILDSDISLPEYIYVPEKEKRNNNRGNRNRNRRN